MKLNNNDVLIFSNTLQRLIENRELKFNVTTGYLMAKNKSLLDPLVDLIYNTRQEIIDEYNTGSGNEIYIPEEKLNEANQKIQELMNIENDIDIVQIPLQMLEENKLNLEDMLGLIYMIQPIDVNNTSQT